MQNYHDFLVQDICKSYAGLDLDKRHHSKKELQRFVQKLEKLQSDLECLVEYCHARLDIQQECRKNS